MELRAVLSWNSDQAAWLGNLARRFFHFSKALRPALGLVHPPIQRVLLYFSPGVKQQGHEGDLVPPNRAKFKIFWSYSTTLPCGAKLRMGAPLPVSLLRSNEFYLNSLWPLFWNQLVPFCSNVRHSDLSGTCCSKGWQRFCFCLVSYKDRLLKTRKVKCYIYYWLQE